MSSYVTLSIIVGIDADSFSARNRTIFWALNSLPVVVDVHGGLYTATGTTKCTPLCSLTQTLSDPDFRDLGSLEHSGMDPLPFYHMPPPPWEQSYRRILKLPRLFLGICYVCLFLSFCDVVLTFFQYFNSIFRSLKPDCH